jgi:hypothetical protein
MKGENVKAFEQTFNTHLNKASRILRFFIAACDAAN